MYRKKYVNARYIELDSSLTDDASSQVQEELDLDAMLKLSDETFSCMLDRMRHERKLSAADLYKAAWVHKSVYSKIMSNIHYKPAKITAIAFAIALKLPWDELLQLVGSAGYSMTRTSKFDIVIEYFVKNQKYSIEEINSTLFNLDPNLPLIGC